MLAALGCNLAWGLVDAVMYLIHTLTDRTRNRNLAKDVIGAEPASARRLIEQALPAHLSAITGPDEIEGMRQRLLALMPSRGATLGREVYLAAVGIFLLVGRPPRRKLREEQVHRLTQIPPPQRYCQAIPTKSKLFPVRADTPLLA